MTQISDLTRQSFAALGALAITATLLFGSFAPPAAADTVQGTVATDVLA